MSDITAGWQTATRIIGCGIVAIIVLAFALGAWLF